MPCLCSLGISCAALTGSPSFAHCSSKHFLTLKYFITYPVIERKCGVLLAAAFVCWTLAGSVSEVIFEISFQPTSSNSPVVEQVME